MKIRLVVFALLILFPLLSFGQDSILFRNVNYDEGLKMAQAEKKPVFFMCYASWCEHCHKMLDKIFKDKYVADYYNSHFICLKQDMEKGDGIKLHDKFQVKAYPTFVFLDSSGTTLFQCVGEYSDSEMINEGKYALTPEFQYPYLKQQFESDPKSAGKCFAYIIALRNGRLDCTEPAMKYLATQSDSELLSEMNWKIIANGVTDINSRPFQFVLAHQKEYAAIASPGRVKRKIVNIVEEMLSPLANANDSAGYFSKRVIAASMHEHEADSIIFKFDILMYEKLGNWNAYKKVTLQNVETIAWNNLSQLKDILYNYLSHCTDSTTLLTAAKWAKHAIELNDEYSSYILCAKLYQKAGDKKDAIEMAQKGKALAVKYGWGHKDADFLLTELQK